MNYLLKNKPRNETRSKVFLVIGIFVFLSLFGFLFPNFLRSSSLFVAKPLWKAASFVASPFGNVGEYLTSKKSLINDKAILDNQIKDLKLKQIDYDLLSKENQDLRIQLGIAGSSNRVTAHVLSKPPLSPYDTLVIDAGTLQGIISGSKVYYGDNTIIGLVKQVASNASIVELFTSGNIKQESVLLRTGTSFTLVGRGGANFGLEVPKDTDILWGDVFVYPGLSSSVLGSVYYIDVNSQSSFKTVFVRIPNNVFQAQWVFVEQF